MESFTFSESRLRKDRLAKLQAEMARQDVGGMLLTNPIHIRYATDVSVMPIWTSVNLARYAFVPVSGDPVLFEYGKALFRAQEVLPQSKKALAWQFRFSQHEVDKISKQWAQEIEGLLRETTKSKRLAVDPLDFYGHQALRKLELDLCDTDPVFDHAQLIKTDDEIDCLKKSCNVADHALSAMREAIHPGITEYELLATFWGKMLSLGGEHCSTRLIVSGSKTNPWFHEAGPRQVQDGELVGVDTDMIGPRGYLCDISRTFLCGTTANAEQKEAYRVAYDFVSGLTDLCRDGTEFSEIMAKAPVIPPEYRERGYSCMIHGSGLDDEPPFFPFPLDAAKGSLIPRGVMKQGMVLSVEFFAGKVGAKEGVKLEEQIVVGKSGPELLSRFPFEESLLGS